MTRYIFLISAPSGTGKTTVIQRVLAARPELRKVVTTTSRPRRSNEVPGRDYHFVTSTEFEALIGEGRLVEWKNHFGSYYGLTWEELLRQPASPAIFDMDVAGKDEFVSRIQGQALCTTIFLAPPSIATLQERIRLRDGDGRAEPIDRLARAQDEISQASTYDYIVVNRLLEVAITEVLAIIDRVRDQKMTAKYICIEGLIGAGKTTLGQILASATNHRFYSDPFEQNTFLNSFYASGHSWALNAEITFVLLRHALDQRIGHDLDLGRSVIADFTMYRSLAFAKTTLSDSEFEIFKNVYDFYSQQVRQPDLIIRIDAQIEELYERILARGRAAEQLGVDRDYLERLALSYDDVFERLSIPTERFQLAELDVTRSNAILRDLVARFASSL